MNVIFLDIDGVMNSHVFYEKRYKRRWRKPITYWRLIKKIIIRKIFKIQPKSTSLANHKTPANFYDFEHQFYRLKKETCPQKWKWLSEWCNETETKICISSVWRNHFRCEKHVTPEKWENAFKLLGFNDGTFVGITGKGKKCRGEEIKEWLNQHTQVEDYIILDDDSDMLDEQFSHFHHVDGWFGLSPNHLYRMNKQFEKIYKYNNLVKIFNDE